MKQLCKLTGKNFIISSEEENACLEFGIDLPQIVPEERIRKCLAFLPSTNFFKRYCDHTKKEIFSVYPANTFFPVYDFEYWKNKEFNAQSFFLDFDGSRTFLEQLQEIWQVVPRPAVVNESISDSTNIHNSINIKNSYWIFNSFNLQNCLYSTNLIESNNSLDCSQLYLCNNCYESVHCFECDNLYYSTQCVSSKNSWFLFNCNNCENCLCCVNLENKKYHVFNKPVSPEEFGKLKEKMGFYARPLLDLVKDRFQDFLQQFTLPHLFSFNSKGSSGNYLRDCKKVIDSFECYYSKGLINCQSMLSSENCLESVYCTGVKNSAYAVGCANSKRIHSSVSCYSVENASYSLYCENSKNIFACVGLNNQEYCIFNKQYTKKEYQNIVSKIKKHLKENNLQGTFFPLGFSDYAYNLSLAEEVMPLTKITAQLMGFRWDETQEDASFSILNVKDLDYSVVYSDPPEDLRNLSWQEIKDSIYVCILSGQPFTLTEAEFNFYQDHGLPAPNQCYKERLRERLSRITSPQMFQRECGETGKPLKTVFGSKWKQKIIQADLFKRL